jgi:hypothetical protein
MDKNDNNYESPHPQSRPNMPKGQTPKMGLPSARGDDDDKG